MKKFFLAIIEAFAYNPAQSCRYCNNFKEKLVKTNNQVQLSDGMEKKHKATIALLILLAVVIALWLFGYSYMHGQTKGVRLFSDTAYAYYTVKIGKTVMFDSVKVLDGIPIGVRFFSIDTSNQTITYEFPCIKKK